MEFTAIFGGTFNPFHIGHYEMLEHLCSQSFIKRVLVVPDKIPPHKICDYLAPEEDRVNMCRLMCEKFSKAEICLFELDRKGKSYTIDTVSELKKIYKNEIFAVVCGGDMIASLDTWHRIDRLKRQVAFIAFNRDDDNYFNQNVSTQIRSGANIIVLNKNITSVSSSELRKKIDKKLLPQEIYDYITKTGLYNEGV